MFGALLSHRIFSSWSLIKTNDNRRGGEKYKDGFKTQTLFRKGFLTTKGPIFFAGFVLLPLSSRRRHELTSSARGTKNEINDCIKHLGILAFARHHFDEEANQFYL